ncbi:MAG: hypothetical protein R3E10_17950 [Gemmatimonadota bacterium]
MLKRMIHRSIGKLEREFGYDAAYLHEVTDVSLGAALRFLCFGVMDRQHAGVPPAAMAAARIAATRSEDCGPCAQLTIDMARAAGVPDATLQAIVARNFERLPPDAALALRFAEACLKREPADSLRDEVRRRFGPEGLVTLAFTISGARVYPSLKRVLGHAQACERLTVGGESVEGREVVW